MAEAFESAALASSVALDAFFHQFQPLGIVLLLERLFGTMGVSWIVCPTCKRNSGNRGTKSHPNTTRQMGTTVSDDDDVVLFGPSKKRLA